MKELLLRSTGISKRFGGVQALDKIQFELKKGEVHALVGENGAGKSTYIKILAGIYRKDAGETYYNGELYDVSSNLEARRHGIGMVPQLIDLAPKLTVAENIYMGMYPRTRLGFVDWKQLYSDAEKTAKTFGMDHLVGDLVQTLGTGHRQLIEILKALIFDTKIIAFDEPTAALSDDETKSLFRLIEQLRERGIAIIYVSHRLDELFQIADRVTVLKDGKYIGTKNVAEVTKDEIVSMMVGRELDLFGEDTRKTKARDEVLFEVKNLKSGSLVRDVSFNVRAGEILGCFGMVGSGRTEAVMAAFGAEKLDEGEVFFRGTKADIKTPENAVRMGIGLVPENRITQGVILKASIKNNITLPFVNKLADKRGGFIDMKREKQIVVKHMKALSVKAPDETVNVHTLSGGNQQKVSIAKWLATRSDVIIFDEPTHGIDVGAKADIYELLRELSEEGKAVVMISSELPEIMNVCDRILIFRDGRVVHEFTDPEGLTEQDVVRYALG